MKRCKYCGAEKVWHPGRKRGGSLFCSNAGCFKSKAAHDARIQGTEPTSPPPRRLAGEALEQAVELWGEDDEKEFHFEPVRGRIADQIAAMVPKQAKRFMAWFNHPPAWPDQRQKPRKHGRAKAPAETFTINTARIMWDEKQKRLRLMKR